MTAHQSFHILATLVSCILLSTIRSFIFFGFLLSQIIVLRVQYGFSPLASSLIIFVSIGSASVTISVQDNLYGQKSKEKKLLTVSNFAIMLASVVMLICAALHSLNANG